MSRVINSKGKENITINKYCTSVRFDIPSVENVFVSSTVARQNVFFLRGGNHMYGELICCYFYLSITIGGPGPPRPLP